MLFLILLTVFTTTTPAPNCSRYEEFKYQNNQSFDQFLKENPTQFIVTKELEPAVNFWKQIFTVYDSSQVVIHDRDSLVVWATLKLPMKNGKVDEAAANKYIKQSLEFYKERLKRVSFGIMKDDEDTKLFHLGVSNGQNNLRFAWEKLRVQRGVADKFNEGLMSYNRLHTTVAGILRDNGIPSEVIALPFVESSYNVAARSAVGAASIWQIMKPTGKFLGLKINKKLDERYDVIKSTKAASKLLKIGYNELGSYELSILAYNGGIGNVRKAIKKVGSRDIEDVVNYEGGSFRFAVQNYYCEFLAVVSILRDKGLL